MTYKRITHKTCKRCERRLSVELFEGHASKHCIACKAEAKASDKKRCSQCKETLPKTSFARCGDGFQGYCKTCQAENSRRYQLSMTADQKRAKAKREWERRKNDPHYNKRMKEWRNKNREKRSAVEREWRKNNRLAVRVYYQNHRAKKNGILGRLKINDWRFMLSLCGFTCLSCEEKTDDLVLDHVIAMSKGGLNIIENIQPLCPSCNMKKGTRNLDFRTEEFNQAIRENCSLGNLA